MTDTGAHPGVRSLLARFENNQSSTASTVAPPRGRSPIGSDNAGTRRNLSKVRASFVPVERASPISGVWNISSPVDNPAAQPRVRSFNSDDLEAALKSAVSLSSPSSGHDVVTEKSSVDQSTKDAPSTDVVDKKPTAILTNTGDTTSVEKATSRIKTQPASHTSAETAPAPPSQKPTKTVTKRPSSIQVGRTTSANKSSATTAQKSPGHPRAPASPTKTSRLTHSTKSAVTKDGNTEPARTTARKPSRPSLNPTAKAATRPVRSSMPARDAAKPTTISSTSNARSRSPTKSARVPTSRTTPAPSATKTGSGPALSRKPSSLKKAASGSQSRATTPTNASIRKQASRPSLPSHSGSDRPPSRASSSSTRPVDEGFLARMMRPTASSASKAHDRVEAKSPTKGYKVVRATRKVPSKISPRGTHRPTEKSHPEQSQEENSPTASAEQTGPKKELQPAPVLKEALNEYDAKPEDGDSDKAVGSVSDVIEKHTEESTEPSVTESVKDSNDTPVEPLAALTSEALVEEPAAPKADEPVEEPLEAITEQPADVDETKPEEAVAAAAEPYAVTPETAETQPEDPSSPKPEAVEADLGAPEKFSENPSIETESKSDDIASEMEKMTIS